MVPILIPGAEVVKLFPVKLVASNVPVREVFFVNAIEVILPWIPNTFDRQYNRAYCLLEVPSINTICPDLVVPALPKTAARATPCTLLPFVIEDVPVKERALAIPLYVPSKRLVVVPIVIADG